MTITTAFEEQAVALIKCMISNVKGDFKGVFRKYGLEAAEKAVREAEIGDVSVDIRELDGEYKERVVYGNKTAMWTTKNINDFINPTSKGVDEVINSLL